MTVKDLLLRLARYNAEGCGDWEVHVSILDNALTRERTYGQIKAMHSQPDVVRGGGDILIMGVKSDEVF